MHTLPSQFIVPILPSDGRSAVDVTKAAPSDLWHFVQCRASACLLYVWVIPGTPGWGVRFDLDERQTRRAARAYVPGASGARHRTIRRRGRADAVHRAGDDRGY